MPFVPIHAVAARAPPQSTLAPSGTDASFNKAFKANNSTAPMAIGPKLERRGNPVKIDSAANISSATTARCTRLAGERRKCSKREAEPHGACGASREPSEKNHSSTPIRQGKYSVRCPSTRTRLSVESNVLYRKTGFTAAIAAAKNTARAMRAAGRPAMRIGPPNAIATNAMAAKTQAHCRVSKSVKLRPKSSDPASIKIDNDAPAYANALGCNMARFDCAVFKDRACSDIAVSDYTTPPEVYFTPSQGERANQF